MVRFLVVEFLTVCGKRVVYFNLKNESLVDFFLILIDKKFKKYCKHEV